jgi:hypothetical protein
LDERSLQQGLQQLVETELVYQRGAPPQAMYVFKHALIQDTAYQALLKSKRQQMHQQIAQVSAERFVETKETQPELLVHHYTEAGLAERAIGYWQKAGQRAAQRSTNVEAIAHLTKGLELLRTSPDSSERTQQELARQITLTAPLRAMKGYGAPELETVYARAQELSQQVGKTPQLFPVLWGLWYFYFVRAEYRIAQELGQQCLALTGIRRSFLDTAPVIYHVEGTAVYQPLTDIIFKEISVGTFEAVTSSVTLTELRMLILDELQTTR